MGNLPLRNPGTGPDDTLTDDGRGPEKVLHLARRVATHSGSVQTGLDLVFALEIVERLGVLLRGFVLQYLFDAQEAPGLARFRGWGGQARKVGIVVLLPHLAGAEHGTEGQLGGAADQLHHVVALDVGGGDDDVPVTRGGHRGLADSQPVDTFLDDVPGQFERVLLDRRVRRGQSDGHAALQVEAEFRGPGAGGCRTSRRWRAGRRSVSNRVGVYGMPLPYGLDSVFLGNGLFGRGGVLRLGGVNTVHALLALLALGGFLRLVGEFELLLIVLGDACNGLFENGYLDTGSQLHNRLRVGDVGDGGENTGVEDDAGSGQQRVNLGLVLTHALLLGPDHQEICGAHEDDEHQKQIETWHLFIPNEAVGGFAVGQNSSLEQRRLTDRRTQTEMPPAGCGGDPTARSAHHQALTDQEGLRHLGDGLGFLSYAERQGG